MLAKDSRAIPSPSPRRRVSSPSPLIGPPSPPSDTSHRHLSGLSNSGNTSPTSSPHNSPPPTTDTTPTTNNSISPPSTPPLPEEFGYKIDEQEAKRLFKQILSAIEYCHSNGITHRDIKPENILLDEKLDVRLAEFGLCLRFEPTKPITEGGSSTAYSAPEMLRQQPYIGPEIDIWSLGVVLYEMVAGRSPFEGSNEEKLCLNILTGNFLPLDSSVSTPVKDLIQKMLKVDPRSRATIEDIKAHPWLTSSIIVDTPSSPASSASSPPTGFNLNLSLNLKLSNEKRKLVPRTRTPHSPRSRLVPRSPRLVHVSSHLSPSSPRLCLSPRSPRAASPRGSLTYCLVDLEAEHELHGRTGVGIKAGKRKMHPNETNLVRSMTKPLTEEELIDLDDLDFNGEDEFERGDVYSAQNPFETLGGGRHKRRSSLGSPRDVGSLFRFVESIPSKSAVK